MRKLILGIYQDSLPATKSWRFVDQSFVFPNLSNPFQTAFPETRSVDNQANNFVGIKIGDVNESASPGIFESVDDRTMGTL